MIFCDFFNKPVTDLSTNLIDTQTVPQLTAREVMALTLQRVITEIPTVNLQVNSDANDDRLGYVTIQQDNDSIAYVVKPASNQDNQATPEVYLGNALEHIKPLLDARKTLIHPSKIFIPVCESIYAKHWTLLMISDNSCCLYDPKESTWLKQAEYNAIASILQRSGVETGTRNCCFYTGSFQQFKHKGVGLQPKEDKTSCGYAVAHMIVKFLQKENWHLEEERQEANKPKVAQQSYRQKLVLDETVEQSYNKIFNDCYPAPNSIDDDVRSLSSSTESFTSS